MKTLRGLASLFWIISGLSLVSGCTGPDDHEYALMGIAGTPCVYVLSALVISWTIRSRNRTHAEETRKPSYRWMLPSLFVSMAFLLVFVKLDPGSLVDAKTTSAQLLDILMTVGILFPMASLVMGPTVALLTVVLAQAVSPRHLRHVPPWVAAGYFLSMAIASVGLRCGASRDKWIFDLLLFMWTWYGAAFLLSLCLFVGFSAPGTKPAPGAPGKGGARTLSDTGPAGPRRDAETP